MNPLPSSDKNAFFAKVSAIIDRAQDAAVRSVNEKATLANWEIGRDLRKLVDAQGKGKYGNGLVDALSAYLTEKHGKGWSVQQLRHCIRLYDTFPDQEKLYTLCRELHWSHLRTLIYVKDALKREFYMEMTRLENWSVRQLQERIKSMLYERTAISKAPEETIQRELEALRKEQKVSNRLVFRDPYLFDFLELSDSYSEKDLEDAILTELQRFIIEMGSDFAFLARQKRLTIDDRDYYVDLVFYHRRLKCLVVIELKLGEFEAAYKGQMELYLRYLEKYEQIEGENPPIGLILCTGKNEGHIELLRLDESNIRVAEYLTKLPSKEVLKSQLQRAIFYARQRVGAIGKSEEE